jgi:hypothetical protein
MMTTDVVIVKSSSPILGSVCSREWDGNRDAIRIGAQNRPRPGFTPPAKTRPPTRNPDKTKNKTVLRTAFRTNETKNETGLGAIPLN